MKELRELYELVNGFGPGCGLTSQQKDKVRELNVKYNEVSGSRVFYTPCTRASLILKVKTFLKTADVSND